MSLYTNPHRIDQSFDDSIKSHRSHLMNQSVDQTLDCLTFFDTRSLDRDRKTHCGSASPSKASSMSSSSNKSSAPMTPMSGNRTQPTFSQLSDRMIAAWQPETGNLKRSSWAQRSSPSHTCVSTRPGTPMIPAQLPVNKRATLPSSFKMVAINEPAKVPRRQTTLRTAGASICEERSEGHEDW
jgi:hypothetical protein